MTPKAGFALVLMTMLLGPGAAFAEFYRWTDDQGHTYYTDGMHGIPERYRAKAVPLTYKNAPAPPPGSASSAASGASGGATIRFTPGERIMVEAKINRTTPVRLLLDTGADRTLVSPKILTDAGVITGAVTGQIVGVTGKADARTGMLESLEVQNARVAGMTVVSFDMKSPGVDGLLGRDFLEQFHVAIDSATGTVTIKPK